MSESTGCARAERLFSVVARPPSGILGPITAELAQVEELFRANLASPVAIVDEIGTFVHEGGGKRVRPTLHLLAARLCEYEGPHRVLLATVLEFIHSATLIHDDIIDEATTRRGRPAVNFRWGNSTTVLFGDYLFAKAMELALRAGSLGVMEKLAEVTLRMTEGEMLQTRYLGRVDVTEAEYLDLVEKKTASLFACCCELAGRLAGQDEERLEALHGYGLNLGMAFQLVDDLLDFTGDADTLGKPIASDLREGKVTLAVLDLLAGGAPEARSLVHRVVRTPGGAPEGCSEESAEATHELTALLHGEGAIERSHRRAQRYAARAIEQLEAFPDGPARRTLATFPDLLLFRDR